jgi:hypothetical protein
MVNRNPSGLTGSEISNRILVVEKRLPEFNRQLSGSDALTNQTRHNSTWSDGVANAPL